MLKKPITFINFENQSVTEDFYFNLTKVEIIELDAEYDDDVRGLLNRIGEGKEPSKVILAFFKDLIGRSYGELGPDKKFLKSQERTEAFTITDAYSELILEIFQKPEKAAEFIEGLMPQALVQQVMADREKLEQVAGKDLDEVRAFYQQGGTAGQRIAERPAPQDHLPSRKDLRQQ